MTSLTNIATFALALCLCACSATTIAPAEQLQQSLTAEKPMTPVATKSGRDIIKKQAIHEYRCAEKKIVRIQQPANKKNATITVMFNNMSYKLSPTISDQGKKYSNIRWTWLEGLNGKATLSNNRNKVLAKHCVKRSEK